MTALDRVPRYRVERPLASAMVPMRAVWRLNCSVVRADSACWRDSGSVGWSMASPSQHEQARRRPRPDPADHALLVARFGVELESAARAAPEGLAQLITGPEGNSALGLVQEPV